MPMSQINIIYVPKTVVVYVWMYCIYIRGTNRATLKIQNNLYIGITHKGHLEKILE